MSKQTNKPYKCTQCNHVENITTNHYGPCWSWGRHNCCPKCPPYKKYSEYGGQTVWVCEEDPPKGTN